MRELGKFDVECSGVEVFVEFRTAFYVFLIVYVGMLWTLPDFF